MKESCITCKLTSWSLTYGTINMILKGQVHPAQQVDTEGVPLMHPSGSQTGLLEFTHIAEML